MNKNKEIRLLILSARINFSEQEKEEFEMLIQSDIDWHYFITACLLNDIPFLFLYHVISNGLSSKVNRGVMEYLNIAHIGFGYKYEMHLNELKELSNLFNGNLDYAVIKGISIIDKIYQGFNFCLRPFGDIDLLVSTENTNKVKQILCDNGYIQGEFSIDQQDIIKATRKEIVYWKYSSHQLCTFAKMQYSNQYDKINKVSLDVNTTIFEGGTIKDKIPTKEILTHTKKCYIEKDVYYTTLELEYDLLQLCYHCYKDLVSDYKRERKNEFSLLKFCDIRELINKYYSLIDWKGLACLLCLKDLGYQLYFVFSLLTLLYPDMKEKVESFIQSIKPNDVALINSVDDYIHNNVFIR